MNPEHYVNLAERFDSYYNASKATFPTHPSNLYDPVQYFLGLDGKRVRPLLVLIAADCFGGEIRDALPAAASVELFHNFSLIHDDIMDKAPLRRGNPTVHEKWNSNVAILSGDVLLVKAYQELAKCKDALRLQSIFSETAIGVCEGQQLDMDFESRDSVTVSEYLEMIRLKTAVLLAASLQLGALCAGAGEEKAQRFYSAGEKLGLAFQLTDDYLDVFGDAGKTGKQEGGDILSNKKTWLLINALEKADQKQKAELTKWFSVHDNPSGKVAAVKKIFAELQVPALLNKQIDLYYEDAFTDLRTACDNKEKTENFISFIKTLVRREK